MNVNKRQDKVNELINRRTELTQELIDISLKVGEGDYSLEILNRTEKLLFDVEILNLEIECLD